MKDLNNILPLETAELPEGTEERIKKSVREKIKCSNEREDQIMIKPKTKRRIKPLFLAAAIAALAAGSVLTVNAATDDSVTAKLKMLINGEEVEKEAVVKENKDGSVTFEFSDDGFDSEEKQIEIDIDGEERNTAVELNTELEDSSAEQSGS